MSTLKVDTILKRTGTGTITLGQSGDTITVPSGATMDLSNATQTGVGGSNTPSFTATLSADTSISDDTVTLVPCNTEVFDTNNAYDNTAGNYKFTPQVAGKYFVFVYAQCNASSGQGGDIVTYIYKNGSALHESEISTTDGATSRLSATAVSIVDMNGSTDYVQGYVLSNVISGTTTLKAGTNLKTRFGAFRILT